MKRVSLFFLSLIVIFNQSIDAQEYADTTVVGPVSTIVADRMNIPFSKQSRAIEVITKEEIKLPPVQSFAELLQYYPGLDIKRRGVNGVQADAGIRGGSFDQTLVLINGIKMNDQQTGHHMMNLPVAIQDIERIEIVKGPASRIYGQNALSGAINIITKQPSDFTVSADLSYGSYQTNNQQVTLTAPRLKNYSQSLSLGRMDSDGYRYNTDYNIRTANYTSNLEINNNNQMQFFAGYTERKFGANAFYASEDFQDQYEEVQTSIVSVSSRHIVKNVIITGKVNWRRNQDIYVFLRDNPSFFRNRHLGNRVGGEVAVSIPLGKNGVLGLGTEVANEYLRSNNLGDWDREIFGTYIDYRWSYKDKLFIQPGVFINKWSDQKFQAFPGIDVSYAVNNRLSMYSSFNIANRIPTYTDLYYTSPAESGNPDLETETMSAFEVGMRFVDNPIQIKVSAYLNKGQNLIDWAKDSIEQTTWNARNFRDIDTRGLEASVAFQLHTLIDMPGKTTVSYNVSLIDSESSESIETVVSRYALDHLRNQHIYGITSSFFRDKLSISLLGRSVQRNAFEGDPAFNFTLLDSRLSWSFNAVDIYLNLNNITDTKYRETTLVEMPGRNFLLGVKAQIF